MKRKIQFVVLAVGIAFSIVSLALFGASAQQPKAKPIDFNREIRPILSDTCFACHGQDDKQRMAKLRFDTKEGAFPKPGVIVPGDSVASKLIKRITSKDPNSVMPPPESGRILGAQHTLAARSNP